MGILKMKTPPLRRIAWASFIIIVLILSALVPRWHISGLLLAKGLASEAVVEKVIDGDTVILFGGEKIRYLGINAPETMAWDGNQWITRPQIFGEKAKKYNQKLVEGKKVSLVYDQRKRDAYHRLLAYVSVGDVFLNGELLRQGLALMDVRFPNLRYQNRLAAFEQEAKDHHRGLWGKLGGVAIPAQDAINHLGEIGVVQGKITSVHLGKKKLYLNFGEKSEKVFTCLIWKENLNNFPVKNRDLTKQYLGKKVRAYGFIKEIHGPVMIICTPNQIDIVN